MSAEGFKGHVATDGSLLGTAGKWRACGWSVVQLDSDKELGPLYDMQSKETNLRVQRTIKRAELTAFLCLQKNDWTHHGAIGIIDVLRTVGRRVHGGCESKDSAARERRGVRSQLSLSGGGMERL